MNNEQMSNDYSGWSRLPKDGGVKKGSTLELYYAGTASLKGTKEMNANELADELESRMPAGYWTPPELLAEAATMLRLQQAEIEVYREALEKLARLGNGDNYGNSMGNDIAIDALRKAQEK